MTQHFEQAVARDSAGNEWYTDGDGSWWYKDQEWSWDDVLGGCVSPLEVELLS